MHEPAEGATAPYFPVCPLAEDESPGAAARRRDCACFTCAFIDAQRAWAKGIARGVADHYGFRRGSQETLELEAVALCELVRSTATFDVSQVPAGGSAQGQFRGRTHPFVRYECQRHALRLRNGGTFHTRPGRTRAGERQEPIVVEDLPRKRGEFGDEYVDLADPRSAAPAPHPVTGAADEALADALLRLLSPRERRVVCLRFGIDALDDLDIEHPHSWREVAADLRVYTVDQVRRICAAALEKLKGVAPHLGLTPGRTPPPTAPGDAIAA